MSKRSKCVVYKYPKPKWSYNLHDVEVQIAATQAGMVSVTGEHVVRNPARTRTAAAGENSSAVNMKVKHITVKGCLQNYISPGATLIVAAIYIPEAFAYTGQNAAFNNLDTCIFYAHPEWVMAWKRFDYVDETSDSNEFQLSSGKLCRNLTPGDSIDLVCILINRSATNILNNRIMTTFSYVCRNN